MTSAVRFNPSGVISKDHEMIRATMKPSATNTTEAGSTHSGASSVGNRIHASSISSHATTAYTSATLSTWRRFSSTKKLRSLIAMLANLPSPACFCSGDRRANRATPDQFKAPGSRCRDYRRRSATTRKLCLSRRARRKPARFDKPTDLDHWR